MNKADLITAVAEQTGEPKTKVGDTIDAVFDALTKALQAGDEVRVPNFGVFKVVETAARKARNPQTGAEVKVPAGRRARFQAGKALKEALDAKPAKGKKK